MKIGIYLNYWIGWGGGIGLISNLLHALQACKKFEVHLLLNVTEASLSGRNVTDMQISGSSIAPLVEISARTLIHSVTIFFDINKLTQEREYDFLGFTGSPPPHSGLAKKWVSYFPDFQHRHMPKYFKQEERISRDKTVRQILEDSALVFFTSRSVYVDAISFLPTARDDSNIYILPRFFGDFSHMQNAFVKTNETQDNKKYFVSCSQEWPHKRHDVIISAFAKLLEKMDSSEIDNYRLVFTGERNSYDVLVGRRSDELIAKFGIADKIHYTGYVNKEEQLAYIKHAIALIQASEFEGQPGASGMLEAAALGTPIIASRVQYNLDLDFGSIQYYELNNTDALAEKMRECAERTERLDTNFFNLEEVSVINQSFGLQLYSKLKSSA